MKNLLIFIIPLIIYPFVRVLILQKKRRIIQINLESNFFIESIKKTIEEKKYNLLEERRRLKKIDPYGNENLSRWIGTPPLNEFEILKNINGENSKFKEGIPYFWKVVLLKDFIDIETFFMKWDSYRKINPFIDDETEGITRELIRDDWFAFIASLIEKSCITITENDNHPESNYKLKKGIKFESSCKQILRSKGWQVEETSITGDQGVDLIASLQELRICIQCKDHIKPIGNRAVQEVSAGKIYWKGTHAVLVSKSGFTRSAVKLAKANRVILVNDKQLVNIEEFFLHNKN